LAKISKVDFAKISVKGIIKNKYKSSRKYSPPGLLSNVSLAYTTSSQKPSNDSDLSEMKHKKETSEET